MPEDPDATSGTRRVKDALIGPDGQLYVAASRSGVEDEWVYRTTERVVAAEDDPVVPPASFRLEAPYPNPSAGGVTVPLVLAEASEVRVAVFDVLGREVAVLHAGPLGAGRHEMLLDARLPAGVYVVRATGGGLSATERLTLLE